MAWGVITVMYGEPIDTQIIFHDLNEMQESSRVCCLFCFLIDIPCVILWPVRPAVWCEIQSTSFISVGKLPLSVRVKSVRERVREGEKEREREG